MKTFSVLFLLFASIAVSGAAESIDAGSESRPAPIPQPAGPPVEAPRPREVPNPNPASRVLPPQAAFKAAPPVPHQRANFLGSKPDPSVFARMIPHVEIWRAGDTEPQIRRAPAAPATEKIKLQPALVGGDEPLTVILRFNRVLAGELITLKGKGVIVSPGGEVMRLAQTAEAMLQVQLEPGERSGKITVSAGNVATTLPVMRVPESMLPSLESTFAREVGR